MDEATFSIESVMIHDVPRGGRDATDMTLTDAPIQLDRQLREYFRAKIINSLKHRGVDVVFDPNKDESIADAVGEIIQSSRALPPQSRIVAQRLHAVQTGVNPPGLLTVISGTVDSRPAVAILKLEREQGIRFQVRQVNGRSTVDLQFLRDLTLTNKTKVFKTSLFSLEREGDLTSIVGRVSDDQRGLGAGRGVADFFLNTFLGCQLSVNPARATLEFVQAAESFFNDDVTDPEKRGRYQVALLSAMQDEDVDIAPRAFAAKYLASADRAAFLDRVQHSGLSPNGAFEKDLSMVKVSGFRMTFENGMVLVGSPEDLSERVRIRAESDAQPGVDINDAVKRLMGR